MTEDEIQVFKIQDQAKDMNIPPRESTLHHRACSEFRAKYCTR